jgi:hypothetical protein
MLPACLPACVCQDEEDGPWLLFSPVFFLQAAYSQQDLVTPKQIYFVHFLKGGNVQICFYVNIYKIIKIT